MHFQLMLVVNQAESACMNRALSNENVSRLLTGRLTVTECRAAAVTR
jgi:hypothetical protein